MFFTSQLKTIHFQFVSLSLSLSLSLHLMQLMVTVGTIFRVVTEKIKFYKNLKEK